MPLTRKQKSIIIAAITAITESTITQRNKYTLLLETDALVLIDNENENKRIISRVGRIARPKTHGFWIDIFPYLNDENELNNFRAHFRIKRSTFNRLLEVISQHSVYQSSNFQTQTHIEIQVGIVLQRLANPMGYRQLETMFGISQGSVQNFTQRFFQSVLDLLKRIIQWPAGDVLQETVEGFSPPEFTNWLPNVIGAVDRSHIPIQRPKTLYHNRYINRKGFYSVVLMVIVDHMEKFTYIHSGQPGSMHDARVLKQTNFWARVCNICIFYTNINVLNRI